MYFDNLQRKKGTYIIHILETSKIQTSTFQGTFQKVGAAPVWTSFWQITLENELRCQCWVEVSRGQQFNRSTKESYKSCLITFRKLYYFGPQRVRDLGITILTHVLLFLARPYSHPCTAHPAQLLYVCGPWGKTKDSENNFAYVWLSVNHMIPRYCNYIFSSGSRKICIWWPKWLQGL